MYQSAILLKLRPEWRPNSLGDEANLARNPIVSQVAMFGSFITVTINIKSPRKLLHVDMIPSELFLNNV